MHIVHSCIPPAADQVRRAACVVGGTVGAACGKGAKWEFADDCRISAYQMDFSRWPRAGGGEQSPMQAAFAPQRRENDDCRSQITALLSERSSNAHVEHAQEEVATISYRQSLTLSISHVENAKTSEIEETVGRQKIRQGGACGKKLA